MIDIMINVEKLIDKYENKINELNNDLVNNDKADISTLVMHNRECAIYRNVLVDLYKAFGTTQPSNSETVKSPIQPVMPSACSCNPSPDLVKMLGGTTCSICKGIIQ